jgi:hypothetical protein
VVSAPANACVTGFRQTGALVTVEFTGATMEVI